MTFLFCRWRLCCFSTDKNSPRASSRSDAKCCALKIFGRASEPAKVFSICCISHFTFSLTLLSGVTGQSTEQRIKLTFVQYLNNRDRAGYESRPTQPQITFILRCMRVCVLSDLSKRNKKYLLLCKCTGRVCGEVKTLLAHPVWDSLSCVFCPKPLNTHMQRRARQTCGPWLIMPYARHYAEVRCKPVQEMGTGAHLFRACANILADCRIIYFC